MLEMYRHAPAKSCSSQGAQIVGIDSAACPYLACSVGALAICPPHLPLGRAAAGACKAGRQLICRPAFQQAGMPAVKPLSGGENMQSHLNVVDDQVLHLKATGLRVGLGVLEQVEHKFARLHREATLQTRPVLSASRRAWHILAGAIGCCCRLVLPRPDRPPAPSQLRSQSVNCRQ